MQPLLLYRKQACTSHSWNVPLATATNTANNAISAEFVRRRTGLYTPLFMTAWTKTFHLRPQKLLGLVALIIGERIMGVKRYPNVDCITLAKNKKETDNPCWKKKAITRQSPRCCQ